MKVTIALLTIACMILVWGTGLAFGVSFLKYEREFGGKGSTNGAFSKNVNIAFDAEGNIHVSDADNRLVQKLSSKGEFLMQIPNDPKSLENFLKKPGDIAVDGGWQHLRR